MNRRQMLAASALGAGALATGLRTSLAATETTPYGVPISTAFPFNKKSVNIAGSKIAYVDEGTGPVVVFLHGNPTSSYLWRNIIPHVVKAGYRAIAPDLIGMGDSGKPEIGYTFEDHAIFIDGFLDSFGISGMTLVVHDWGSALGMSYARLNPDKVSALAFMEAIIPPSFPVDSYEAMGPLGDLFRNLRTEGVGEKMVLENNFFVEEILPKMGVARGLTEEEMAYYRAPFPTPGSRLPTLQWPREIPIGDEPAATTLAVTQNGAWLKASPIPKLFFYATPGAIAPEPVAQWIIANTPNLESRFLGKGTHFLQEDHPHAIGTGLADWLRRINKEDPDGNG